ncbi:MAG: prepilin-type N-terminal cleavage/methylation domain-containing protein [Candidatus Levybacteria bacterium]|nr:prepilin-type N-terminal cleavage/methylation domain-containing protein [Candidatus Levybacteria bacterium]
MISINNVILNLFQDLVLEKMRCRNKFGMTRIMGGFTLVELMVVLSISAILGTLGIAGFNNYNRFQIIQNAASDLVTTFNTARSRAQSQVKLGSSCTTGDSSILEGYSVDISDDNVSYTLNSHCSGSILPNEISKKKLPDNVSFINVSTASFFFPVITGGVKDAGSITLSGYGMEKNIVVNPYGGISMQLTPTIFPTSTPIPTAAPTSTPAPTSAPTPTPTPVPASEPPAPWVHGDIGRPAIAGSATYTDDGVFTVRGAGTDIAGSQAQFHYVYQTLTGDGRITARITSQTNTDGWAKAGVMMMDVAAPGAVYAATLVTPENGIQFQYYPSNMVDGGAYTLHDAWVRLERSGFTFTAYKSSNGWAWSMVRSVSISMGDSIAVGLFVTSHDAAELSTATFDNVWVIMP